jgi:hypothetical protein
LGELPLFGQALGQLFHYALSSPGYLNRVVGIMSSSTDTAVTIDRDYFDTLVRRYVSVLFGYQAMHMPPMIGWCPATTDAQS